MGYALRSRSKKFSRCDRIRCGLGLYWLSKTTVYRMTGIDLIRMDGIYATTVLCIIAEISYDMPRWPTEKILFPFAKA